MTPGSQHPQEPKQYICDDDDLGCLHDYLVAALDGNDISELPRLWNTQIGVIRSRPHTSARSEQEILDEFRAIVVQLYDNGFKNPLATFDNARQILRQSRQHPGGRE